MAPLIELVGAARRLGPDHRAVRPLLAARLPPRARRERAGAVAAGAAVQPRGPLPLLARRVVHPLARRRVRRPRVHRRRLGHAGRRVRARSCSTTRASAPRSTRSSRAPTASTVHFRDSVGTQGAVAADECIVTVPFVLLRHMEIGGLDVEKWFAIRNVYYGRAHKIFMQFSRRWWADDYADHARRHRHRPRDPERGLHAGRARTRSIGKGVIIASYAWEQDSMAYSHARRGAADRPGAPGPRQDPPRGGRDVRVRDLARLGARPPRRRHRAALPAARDDEPLLRRHHPPGRVGSGSPTTPATA